MRKEKLVKSYSGEPSARITRARAALCQQNGAITSGEPSKEYVHKVALRSNSKRQALDEKNDKASLIPCTRHKKRAILKDITNVSCENPHKKCLNATKLPKNQKHGKRSPLCGCKLAPSIGVQHLPVDSATYMHQQVENEQLQLSVVTCMSTDNLPLHSRFEEFGEGSGKQSMLKKQQGENILHDGKSAMSEMPDLIDIDADHMDPQLCSMYAPDIYQNLQALETIRRPASTYMEKIQQDINQSMRGILVDWLVEMHVLFVLSVIINNFIVFLHWYLRTADRGVNIDLRKDVFQMYEQAFSYQKPQYERMVCEEYKFVANTLYLTVHFVDVFLSQEHIERHCLQLLGITCMLIASKYEEICAPCIDELCFITANTYTKGEVIALESQVLNTLGFRLSFPTAKTFLRRFLRAAQASYRSPSLEFEFLANYLAESTLVHYGFLKFLPSAIAASAVFLARWTLRQSDHPWNPTLEYYTTYKASDLKTIVHALQALQLNSDKCPLHAVRAKYHQNKFKSVAALPSPELPDALFQT